MGLAACTSGAPGDTGLSNRAPRPAPSRQGAGTGPHLRASGPAVPSPAPVSGTTTCWNGAPPGIPAELARTLCREAARAGVVGFAVARAERCRVTTHWFHGLRCLGRGEPVTADTRFRLGSVTKMLVGIGAANLASQGRVDLDADVHRYLPDVAFVPPSPPVTLATLLSHTAGLSDRPPSPSDGDLPVGALGPFRRSASRPFYSNLGAAVAGAALLRAGGTSDLEAWFVASLPHAELLGSLAVADGRPVPQAACGHLPERDVAYSLDQDFARFAHRARWTAPAGAAAATPSDLAAFLSCLPEPVGNLLTARARPDPEGGPAWTLGARLVGPPDPPLLRMSGNTGTFWTYAAVDLRGHRAVVVATNRGVPLLATRLAVDRALNRNVDRPESGRAAGRFTNGGPAASGSAPAVAPPE